MSIDARVVGISESSDGLRLVLEDRPGGGVAGQPVLVIANAPERWAQSRLVDLIGCDIWGCGSLILLGHSRLAKRDEYQRIVLVEGWEDVIAREVRA